MSKLKTDLLVRKKQIEQQLKPYNDLVKELEEVNKALEPSTCNGALALALKILKVEDEID